MELLVRVGKEVSHELERHTAIKKQPTDCNKKTIYISQKIGNTPKPNAAIWCQKIAYTSVLMGSV